MRVVLATLLVAGCAGAPSSAPAPAATATPELIALRHFFASREANWGYRVHVRVARNAAAGNPVNLLRAEHRREHLDEIERTLGG